MQMAAPNYANIVMFYPGPTPMRRPTCHHHGKKCNRKKQKKREESESESDNETEYYYMRKPAQQYDTNRRNIALTVGDDIGRKMMNREYRGVSGEKKYEIVAPSNPQAVNQYVRSYNYNTGRNKQETPNYDYSLALQQLNEANDQYRTDRMADEYAYALDHFDWALQRQAEQHLPPYRPPGAEKPFDDYYCMPMPGNPYFIDCFHESNFYNNPW